jgi:hypothetical protein
MRVPGTKKSLAQLPAGFHEKCARSHRRIADLEREYLLGRGIVAELLENWLKRRLHNGPSERAGRVVRTRAPPLIGGLEDHGVFGHDAWRDGRGNLAFERGHLVVDRGRSFERLGGLASELLVGLLGKPLGAAGRCGAQQLLKVDSGGSAVPFDRLDGDG